MDTERLNLKPTIYDVSFTLEGVWTYDKERLNIVIEKISKIIQECVNLTPDSVIAEYDRIDVNVKEVRP